MLVILLLALSAISFVVGIGFQETGGVEKVVLLALVAGCVYAAARVTKLASILQEREARH
jgi:hypothetical protein